MNCPVCNNTEIVEFEGEKITCPVCEDFRV